MGPNFSHYKNITDVLQNSTWTVMHYSQCNFVHNALIIPHPQLREEM